MVAFALFTTWESAELVLGFQVVVPAVVPLYSAVMLWVAAPSAEVEQVAWLEAFSVTLQSVVAPSLNVTVPFAPGLPSVAVTVAVNVTLCPYVLGLLLLDTVVVVARVASTLKIGRITK